MSGMIFNLSVFVGLAVLAGGSAVTASLALLFCSNLLTKRRLLSLPDVETRRIRKIVESYPQHLSMKNAPESRKSASKSPRQHPPEVEFVPVRIRVTFRREEWCLGTYERLAPKAHWN